MSLFDDVAATMQRINDNAVETSTKLDVVVQKIAEMKALIEQLQNQGGASEAQLAQLAELANSTETAVQAVEDKVDASVA